MVTLQINWPTLVDCSRPFHRRWGFFVFELSVFRFPKNRKYLVLLPFVDVSFLLVGLSDSASYATIWFAVMKRVISKTSIKKFGVERNSSGVTPDFKWRRWSKDFLGLKFSIPGFFWGRKNLASIFFVGLILTEKYWWRVVLYRIFFGS